MKRVLAAAVLMACLPTAHAQDKGKSEFSHSAEYRVRDTYMQNENGNKDTKPGNSNAIAHRFRLGLDFHSGEKFGAHVTFLHNATWGETSTTQIGQPNASTTEDYPAINEAYASWMMSNDFNMKFGRMNYGFGDGSVMSVNDWEATPNSYEGVLANYEAEFGRFQAFAFKYVDKPAAGTFVSGDPEHNAYALVFDAKTLPEWLKLGSAHIIKDNADGDAASTGTTVTGTEGQDTLRYGLNLGFNFSMVDLKVGYEGVTGKLKSPAYTAGNGSVDVEESMMQAELGLNFANFMGSRVALLYHQDSGTKDGFTAASSKKVKTYDGYFYDKHDNAGLMDLIGWGNLTDVAVTWTLKPMDSTTAGIAYHMFSKTEKADGITKGTAAGSSFTNGQNTAKSNIGNEVDVWGEHKYDGGLSMVARLGFFSPGDALKNATSPQKDTITQAMLEGKLTF